LWIYSFDFPKVVFTSGNELESAVVRIRWQPDTWAGSGSFKLKIFDLIRMEDRLDEF
jgi:hypothetical protein